MDGTDIRGELGAGNLNRLLQEALTTGAPGIERGQRTLRVGDKVMQVKNDYDKEVWNGDSGTVEGVGAETLAVRFDDRLVDAVGRGECDVPHEGAAASLSAHQTHGL